MKPATLFPSHDPNIYLGVTTLFTAALNGYKDLVQTLLQHGADVNAENNKGK